MTTGDLIGQQDLGSAHLREVGRMGMKRNKSRGGFTLPEVLVTVALVSMLAAVVIPSVVGQITAGEGSKLTQGMSGVQTAVEQFASDVHRFPVKPTLLFRATTSADKDVNQITLPAPLANRWKGPYIAKDSVAFFLTGGAGAGGTVLDTFFIKTAGTISYITAVVTGLRTADLIRIDKERDNYSVAGDSAVGMVRFAKDSLFFLLIPIQ
jgi:prepilin-type N-terminal cleavage/methylation domain-containing protein